jgi:hypothetical protein
MPDWSPVRRFGGYQQRAEAPAATAAVAVASLCGCANSCNVHGHGHATAWGADVPVSDARSFWGALGCACWAV